MKALVLALFLASPAAAQQQPCDTRAAILAGLTGQYGETRRAMGISGDGWLIEWWGNGDTGTWTITKTSAGGVMCMIGSGQNFQTIAETLPKPGTEM